MKLKKILALIFSVAFMFGFSPFVYAHNTLFVKIVLVGDQESGKTRLFERVANMPFNEEGYNPSKETQYHITCLPIYGEDLTLVLKTWDTAGAEKYREEVMERVRGANYVFVVHDTSKPYNESKAEYFNQLLGDILRKMAPTGAIALLGSKCDLSIGNGGFYGLHCNMLEQCAKHWASAQGIPCKFIATSARTGQGLLDVKNFIAQTYKHMMHVFQDRDVNPIDNVIGFVADTIEEIAQIEKMRIQAVQDKIKAEQGWRQADQERKNAVEAQQKEEKARRATEYEQRKAKEDAEMWKKAYENKNDCRLI